MVRAVRVHSLQNTYTVQYEDIRVPPPPESHVEIRHTAIVATSYDQLAREGHLHGYSPGWQSLKHPFILGLSGVGVITEVGSGLLDFQIGQRVCYVTADEPGSFSEQRVILAKHLLPVPSSLNEEEIASILFEGVVAWTLLKKVYPVRWGDTVLIHGITSNLGCILAQWAKVLGATVIGTVISDDTMTTTAEKMDMEHIIEYTNFEESVKRITGEEGVSAVFHITGADAIRGSLDCTAPSGMLVVVGGSISEADLKVNKVNVTSPTLQDLIGSRQDLLTATTELFDLVQANIIKIPAKDKYPLQKAAQALSDLTKRRVLRSVILLPPIPDPKDTPHGS